jgi:hypothetical protein
VVGEPPDGVTHPALDLPGVLGASGVGTLWVSDVQGRGCGWWIDSARPITSAEALLRQSDRSALDLLDDCLQIPDVFDGVLSELEDMPNHVASPGLLAFGGRLAADDLLAARLRALRAVTGEGSSARTDPGFEGVLPRGAPLTSPADLDALLTPGLELARTRRAAREAAADAGQVSATAAIGMLGPGGPAWHPGLRVAHARSLAGQFHRAVGRVLNAGHHPGEGLDDSTRDQIRAQGVAPEALAPASADVFVTELGAATERQLRSSSIESTQLWLRLLADAATPRGSGNYLRELATAGTDFPPLPAFPLRPAPAWLLALLAVASFGAGLAGPAGIAAGVLALLGVLLVLSRRPTAAATEGPARSAPVVAGAHLPVVAAGLIAGMLLAGRLGVPTSPGVRAGIVVAAALVPVAGLLGWWHTAARRWLELIDTGGPQRVVQTLDRLLHRVITDEWRLASAKAHLADSAVAVALSLDRIAAVLKEQGSALAAAQRPDQGTLDTGADPSLDALLEGDLRDAVEASLAGVWDQVRTGFPAGAWEMAAARMTECLEDYERHLALHDLNEPPPFARAGRTQARAYGNWGPTRQLADLLDTPADGPLVQLCRTKHTNLLSLSRIRAVRFAPASMRDDVTDELAQRGRSPLLSELCWARSGSLAGLLRLVTPRSGVVEMTWNQTGPGLGRITEEERDA